MLAKPLVWLKDKNRKPSSYEGTVVDNNDPEKLGSVTIRVPQIHGNVGDTEFIPDGDLPWIHQRPSSFLGNSPNSGMFSVPDIGTKVTVEYHTSDPYFGYYKGGVTSSETRTTAFDEDYPHTYGFVDPSGSAFRINKQKNTWDFVHPSGNYIKIHQDTTVDIFQVSGNVVRMNPNGTVDMIAPVALNIVTPVTNISGDVNIGGGVVVNNNVVASDCLSSGKSGKSHTHSDPQGGTTSPPL